MIDQSQLLEAMESLDKNLTDLLAEKRIKDEDKQEINRNFQEYQREFKQKDKLWSYNEYKIEEWYQKKKEFERKLLRLIDKLGK